MRAVRLQFVRPVCPTGLTDNRSSGEIFSFNSIKGNDREMGEVLYILIGVDLWLIFIFKGWEMGNVLESAFSYY